MRTKRPRWLDVSVAIAVLPIAVAALRILLYSGGDPVLMKVLVDTLDIPTLILGTLLPLLPALLWLPLQPLILDASLARQLLGGKSRTLWIILVLVLVLIYLLIGPWPSTIEMLRNCVIGAATGAAIAYCWYVFKERRAGHRWLTALRVRLGWGVAPPVGRPIHVLIIPLVVLAAVFAMPLGMWLPLERVTTGSTPVLAYVLQNENDWATLMEEDKTVLRVPATSITERAICDQGEYESLITTWTGGAKTTPSVCD